MDAGARGSSGGSFISMTRAETKEKEMETNELMIRPHRVATALNSWSFRRLAALNGKNVRAEKRRSLIGVVLPQKKIRRKISGHRKKP